MIMHIALDVHVQVKDDTLVLTDRAGKTITFSKEQTVQKKVSMIALGELCGLPKAISPLASASRRANPITTVATLSSQGHRKTSCPNGWGPTPDQNVPRRSRPSSSVRVSRPMALCMRLLMP